MYVLMYTYYVKKIKRMFIFEILLMTTAVAQMLFLQAQQLVLVTPRIIIGPCVKNILLVR